MKRCMARLETLAMRGACECEKRAEANKTTDHRNGDRPNDGKNTIINECRAS